MAINVTTTGTVTGSVTAATISFTAPDTIADSGSGLGFLSPGDYIVVSGSANNDGNYKVATATAASITVEATVFTPLTTEGAGASVTIDKGVGLDSTDTAGTVTQPIVLVHPSTTDMRTLHRADNIATDALLGAAIDGGDVTMEVDGQSIPDSATLIKIGSGFVGDDVGAESLAATLVAGNTSGGTALQMSTTDQIQLGGTVNHMENGGTGNFTLTTNKSFEFNNADSQIFLQNFGNASFRKPSTSDVMNITPGGGALGYVGTGISGTIDMRSLLTAPAKTWTMPNKTGTVALLSDVEASDTLEEVLGNGNTSGANDILMSNQQKVQFNVAGNYIKEKAAAGALEYTADKGHEFNVGTAQGVIGLVATTLGRTGAGNGTFNFTYGTGTIQYVDVDTGFQANIQTFPTLTGNQTWTMPDATGTVALTSDVSAATLASKAGEETAGSFTGSPLTKAVVFSTAFGAATYSVGIVGADERSWTVTSKTAAGFTIESNSATALTGPVMWTAILHGETS